MVNFVFYKSCSFNFFFYIFLTVAKFHKNITRIAKSCPENITSVVKCVKLLFPKVLRKFLKKIQF